MCEPKRRHRERDDTAVQLGLQAYLKFYQSLQGSSRLKTFDDFASSAYYRAFVKFGRHCQSIRAINMDRFVDWLLQKNKKLDHWCQDRIYTEYLNDYLRLENVADALSRAVEHARDWCEHNSMNLADYLRYGNDNLICHAVTTGRISPWVLYNCESGREFLGRINSEQVAMIWQLIDADFWQKKFLDYRSDQIYAEEILKQVGW